VRNNGLQQLGASVDMALGCMLCVQVGVLVAGRSKNMRTTIGMPLGCRVRLRCAYQLERSNLLDSLASLRGLFRL